MNRQKMNQMLVGIFVLSGFLIAVYLIFVMGSRTGFLRSNFTLYARFKDVKGLHPGSEVSLSGLRVGVVKDISVATDETKEMVATLQVTSKARE